MPPSPGVLASNPLSAPQPPPAQAEKQRESPPSKAQEEDPGYKTYCFNLNIKNLKIFYCS